MFAQVTGLQYWKSEHDEQTCEDAYGESASHGLFAVADGAGTTLFSNIWAKILVQHFLTTPLMNHDPFEVEWWVRQVQEQYKPMVPELGNMEWNALQKMQNQGSHSTLATVRLSRIEPTSVHAQLLVFGDSCVLIGKARTGHVQSFPLDNPSDFEQAPICIPSKRSIFNRYFHQCQIKQVELEAGDVVMLATDAVAKWIVSAGSSRYTQPMKAFQDVVAQTPDTWAAFIMECRARQEMIDDDSTAMIIALTSDALVGAIELAATTEHDTAIRESRAKDFARAVEARNKELMAIYFGDGIDLGLEGVTLPREQVKQAREVADALRAVLQVLRQELNSPHVAAKLEPVWQHYAPLLLEEPCAETVRQTLTRLGVLVAPKAPPLPTPQGDTVTQTGKPQAVPTPPLVEPDSASLPVEHQSMHTDDEVTIHIAHDDREEPLYTQAIPFPPHEEQRIRIAHKRGMHRQDIQAVLNTKNAAQMARAYENMLPGAQTLSEHALNLLQLAHAFIEAYHSDSDEVLLTAAQAIQRPPYYGGIILTQQEVERVDLAWTHKMAQAPPEDTSNPGQQTKLTEQEGSWVSKLARWKGL